MLLIRLFYIKHCKTLQQSACIMRCMSQVQDAQDLIKDQLKFKIDLPKAKEWSKIAVLHALADTVENKLAVTYNELESPNFWFYGKFPSERKFNITRQGSSAANYIIEKYSHLFQHDWASDSVENWINTSQNTLEISSETSKIKNHSDTISDESGEVIQQYINNKKVSNFAQTLSSKLQNNEDISQDLLQQYLGFLAFYKGSDVYVSELKKDPIAAVSSKPINDVHQLTNLTSLFKLLKESSSVEQLSTLIITFPTFSKSNTCTVVSTYQDVLQSHKLDVDVYNHVLLMLKNQKQFDIANGILKTMKLNGVKPNYETFIYYARIPSPEQNSVEGMLNSCGKILSEIMETGIETNIAVISSLIEVVLESGLEKKSQIISCLLDCIICDQHNDFVDVHDIAAFNELMINCSFDLNLMKKIFDISQRRGCFSLLSSQPTKTYAFYSRFLISILKNDKIEEAFYFLQRLVPSKIQVTVQSLNLFVKRILKEKKPEYLPIVLLYFPVKNYHIFDLWLNTALALLDVADDDTKKQLKHIAIIEIKFKHSFDPNLNKIMNLCFELLLSTYDDFWDVIQSLETMKSVAKSVTIHERLIIQFKAIAVQNRMEIEANRILKSYAKAKKSLKNESMKNNSTL